MQKRKHKYISLLSLCFLLFVSCARITLFQNLSEQDANEILVLLQEHGIAANIGEEKRQNEIFFSVEVNKEELSKARSLLVKHQLPRRKELGLPGVYKEKGLIPTPDEQKARYLLALKGEIINSLEKIPELIDADVVLNIPNQSEFLREEEKKRKRPTASVIVRAKPTLVGNPAVTEAKIQQFVANAVEGLNPRDVAVIISYIQSDERIGAESSSSLVPEVMDVKSSSAADSASSFPSLETDESLLGLNLDASSKEKLRLYFLGFFTLLLLLSAGLIVSIVSAARMRKKVAMLSAGEPRQALHPGSQNEEFEEAETEDEMDQNEEPF
ncbi:MAG: hypothetical protein COV43_05345 [Deltaproteobacteria bacterium CG11_big_fil_rev_8_21_14_0_20_42_23]|nr:MAG: hypothetical protein COV43_05345 [Deltaproteobacteria bacterium CG11_big_fil_rev_8_21_14_0_20_42_23]PJC64017.1 MAG: hypothetical protein CO021_06320 [Deltaproteobacteria bacterium CG_4_9_14_0_2_um_filter_42_21]